MTLGVISPERATVTLASASAAISAAKTRPKSSRPRAVSL
jgi:hypothetical protein